MFIVWKQNLNKNNAAFRKLKLKGLMLMSAKVLILYKRLHVLIFLLLTLHPLQLSIALGQALLLFFPSPSLHLICSIAAVLCFISKLK